MPPSWRNYRAFVAAVAPAAERAGVRLAIHPDDPPWPIFGLPRIVNDEASLQAVLDVSTSPAHGLTFCTGARGARADNDLPAMLMYLRGVQDALRSVA
jgi:mannonate dehydratase